MRFLESGLFDLHLAGTYATSLQQLCNSSSTALPSVYIASRTYLIGMGMGMETQTPMARVKGLGYHISRSFSFGSSSSGVLSTLEKRLMVVILHYSIILWHFTDKTFHLVEHSVNLGMTNWLRSYWQVFTTNMIIKLTIRKMYVMTEVVNGVATPSTRPRCPWARKEGRPRWQPARGTDRQRCTAASRSWCQP